MTEQNTPENAVALSEKAKPLTPLQAIGQALDSESFAPKIAASLDGTGISAERFKRAALVALSRPEAVYLVEKCNRASIYSAIMNAAAAGIELHPALNHAYIIPRGGSAQLQISYKGKIAMAMRHPAIVAIDTGVLFAGDDYEYETGTQPRLKIRPCLDEDERGDWIAAYCVTHWKDGPATPILMTRKQIEKHRDKYSDAFKRGGKGAAMWNETPAEMAKKTVIHRASKQWPITIPGGGDGDDDRGEILDHSPAPRPVMRDVTPGTGASRLDQFAAGD
jgi:recombination protein RecT